MKDREQRVIYVLVALVVLLALLIVAEREGFLPQVSGRLDEILDGAAWNREKQNFKQGDLLGKRQQQELRENWLLEEGARVKLLDAARLCVPGQDWLSTRYAEFRLRHDREDEPISCEQIHTFANNLGIVEGLNMHGDAEYSADHSPFGDMSPLEFTQKVLMREVDSRDLGFRPVEGQSKHYNEEIDFDWGDKGAVSAVREQGSIGTCYAFAAAGAVESQLAIHYGVKNVTVSVEHPLECDTEHETIKDQTIADCGEFGGWPHLVFEFWRNQGGFVAEKDFSYCAGEVDPKTLMPACFPCMAKGYSEAGCGDHSDLYCNKTSTQGQSGKDFCTNKSWLHEKRLGTTTSYKLLSTDIEEQIQQIAEEGPSTAVMDATMLQFYHRGVANPWFCSSSAKNHAVLITGHGPGWFRVKNSWGPKWGENGFFRIREGVCGINDIVHSVKVSQQSFGFSEIQ
mmetsp:Transcript_10533/g.20755  ORF Transcript_10533/g.20755 Transcript_10533/m.20755 type:complete len:455 (+) Transcript_10533:62-1426(+)